MLLTNLPRIATNVASMLSSDITNRAATFALYVLVARYLGPFEFGQMSLALTLFYAFQVLAAAGLKTLVTREVARDRALTGPCLMNGSLVATASSAVAIGLLLAFVSVMRYGEDTTAVILLLAVGLLPFALASVCEAIFQAWERMHFIAYASIPMNLVKIGLSFALLHQGYGLYQIVSLFMVCQVAQLLVEWWWVRRLVAGQSLAPSVGFSLHLARSTTTFFGIDALIAIVASLNVVLLSKLAGELEVGLYSAAIQLLAPVSLVLHSVVLGVYPIMCRQREQDQSDLKQTTEHLLALQFAMVFPLVVGLSFLSDGVLGLLYGKPELLPAGRLLQLAAWGLIPTAMTSVLGYTLMATHHQRKLLGLLAAQGFGNLVVGAVLIAQFGAPGAVAMVLLDRVVGLIGHYVMVSAQVTRIDLGKLLWRPVVACTAMAACLVALRDEGIVVSVLGGSLVYGIVLLGLTVWSMGGPGQIRALYVRR